jgi:hypothetical protein
MDNNKLKKAYKFLDLAYKELNEYEKNKEEVILQEACGKGWGAVAQSLKIVNPKIRRHADFGDTTLKLSKEYENEEILHGESCGEALHRTGFYEGAMTKEVAKANLKYVGNFLRLIDNILNGKKK